MKTPSPMARRVRLLREIAGISQRRVSARAGLDPSHVRLLEGSGQRTAATTIARVAAAMGVRSEYLIDGTLPAFVSAPDLNPAVASHEAKVRAAILANFSVGNDPPRAPTPRTRKPSRPKPASKGPGPVKARGKRAPKAQATGTRAVG